MLNWFRKLLVHGPQTKIIIPSAPITFYQPPPETQLRLGMWVKTDGGAVGILSSLSPFVVTMTTGSGENVMVTVDNQVVPKREEFQPHQLTQAKYLDIPEPRRPSVEQARYFGYQE